MYKVAILGTENSHAINFAKLINGGHPSRDGRGCPDFKVIGAYGYDERANKELLEEGGVEYIADNYADFVGKVDAVMITARHGGDHFKFAEPYLKSGIPMFVDKPVTIDENEAIMLARMAKEKNIPLCGGSCCGFVTDTQYLKNIVKNPGEHIGKIMGGSVCAPINMKNDYGDFFFYSQHLVQISLEIFGYDLKSVLAFAREDSIITISRYDNYDVSGHFGPHCYAAAVYGQYNNVYREIDIVTDGYAKEVEKFTDMVRSGNMPQSYSDFIKPVFVLNAIKKSMDTGSEIKIREYDI